MDDSKPISNARAFWIGLTYWVVNQPWLRVEQGTDCLWYIPGTDPEDPERQRWDRVKHGT